MQIRLNEQTTVNCIRRRKKTLFQYQWVEHINLSIVPAKTSSHNHVSRLLTQFRLSPSDQQCRNLLKNGKTMSTNGIVDLSAKSL